MSPAQRFWCETVSMLDVIYLKVTIESGHYWEQMSCNITTVIITIFISIMFRVLYFVYSEMYMY